MIIVKATSLITAALLAAGSHAAAQNVQAPSPVPYLRPVTFPVFVPAPPIDAEPAAPQQPAPAAAPSLDRRDDIKTLELVLTNAVKSGADKLALQMRASEPGSLFVIDT